MLLIKLSLYADVKRSLQALDISWNTLREKPAAMLTYALQENTTLTSFRAGVP